MLPITTIRMPRGQKQSAAIGALSRVGLAAKARRLPAQISSGEKERVAVARAIVNNPPILLADEPTGNLDSKNSKEIMRLLKNLNHSGTTIIMVTHSSACAGYARRVLLVRDGRLVKENSCSCTSDKSVKAA